MSLLSKGDRYNDVYFRIIIALFSAHIIISFGATESFFQLLISWFYYRDLLLSFLISFFLVNLVYWATIQLDKRFDWRVHTVSRAALQVLLGLLAPSILAFILAAGYFALFGFRILDTLYLKFDFPVIVIMLLLLNVYYLAFYFFRQWQLLENKSEVLVKPNSKEVYVVQKGAKIIPLPIETISYFFHDGDYNFLRTFQKEDFIISEPLDEIQAQLSDKQFFRVNRQMVVNFSSCQHFEPFEFGKLKLYVNPEFREAIIVSQKKSKSFKLWIQR